MGIRQFLAASRKRVGRYGMRGVRESLYQLYYGVWANSIVAYDPGRPIWEREWDVLVVLDGFRADLMLELADEFENLDRVDSVPSNASTSSEWIEKNFRKEYASVMEDTAYVSGNPHTEAYGDRVDQFGVLDEVWRYRWDEDVGTIRPGVLNERALDVWDEDDPGRLIVHYMQPHFPSIPHPEFGSEIDPGTTTGADALWTSVWDSLRAGETATTRVWDAYRDNARFVLSAIAPLVRAIDGDRIVITADHGNAFGRFGIYGHPRGAPISDLRRVPWCIVSITDTAGADVETPGARPDDLDVELEDRLSDLGYK